MRLEVLNTVGDGSSCPALAWHQAGLPSVCNHYPTPVASSCQSPTETMTVRLQGLELELGTEPQIRNDAHHLASAPLHHLLRRANAWPIAWRHRRIRQLMRQACFRWTFQAPEVGHLQLRDRMSDWLDQQTPTPRVFAHLRRFYLAVVARHRKVQYTKAYRLFLGMDLEPRHLIPMA